MYRRQTVEYPPSTGTTAPLTNDAAGEHRDRITSATFIQRDRCLLAEAGDFVVYDTRIPYLFGSVTTMRQLLIDIPIATFDDRLDADLGRLFAADGESIAQTIWTERLSRAHRELVDPRLRRTSVGEIAFRWGFSSQAHISRAIRERYGASPMALREAARG
ncbi:hypothetical protein WM29_16475 [Burkholderia ubonensis]|nr:hypothetical protein WM29_16475 [Burkholderia ubonensis]